MSSTALSNLINVRYYTPADPYHYTVDNRPLTDLNTNIVILAGLIEGISSGNIFYIEDTSAVANSLISNTPVLPATGPYTAGQLVTIHINNTNTGPVSLEVNQGVAYPVHGMVGALQGGELVAGKHYLLSWENSDEVWELVGSGKGSLQVAAAVQSAQAVNLGQLTNGSLSPVFDTVAASGVMTAADGLSGNEVVNYSQLTNGSFLPEFSNIVRPAGLPTPNWLVNSSFLYGMTGWQNNGLQVGTNASFTYAYYNNTSAQTLYTYSAEIDAAWVSEGAEVNLSGWVRNSLSYSPATVGVNCYTSAGTLISTIAGLSLPAGEGWTYLTNYGVVPSGTSYLEVVLGYSGTSQGANVGFSELKLENNTFATLWSDEASTQLFQDGVFSPVFEDVTANNQISTDILSVINSSGLANAQANNLIVNEVSKLANGQNFAFESSSSIYSGWVANIDLNNGTIQELTLNSNGSITLSNYAAEGYSSTLLLFLKQAGTGSNTVTWPTNIIWDGGRAPTLTQFVGGVDLIFLNTHDGGTTWYGSEIGEYYPGVTGALIIPHYNWVYVSLDNGATWKKITSNTGVLQGIVNGDSTNLPPGILDQRIVSGNNLTVMTHGYSLPQGPTIGAMLVCENYQDWSVNEITFSYLNYQNSICYGDGIFTTGQYYTSDAVVWSTSNPVSGTISQIHYADGYFVGICNGKLGSGTYNTGISPGPYTVNYSPDGKTWNYSTIPYMYELSSSISSFYTECVNGGFSYNEYTYWYFLGSINTTFVALGEYVYSSNNTSGGGQGIVIALSSDYGQTWTGIFYDFATYGGQSVGNYSSVACGNGLILFGGTYSPTDQEGTTGIIYYSSDLGSTWSNVQLPYPITGVFFLNGTFYALGFVSSSSDVERYTIVYSSTNAETWTQISTIPSENLSYMGVVPFS